MTSNDILRPYGSPAPPLLERLLWRLFRCYRMRWLRLILDRDEQVREFAKTGSLSHAQDHIVFVDVGRPDFQGTGLGAVLLKAERTVQFSSLPL